VQEDTTGKPTEGRLPLECESDLGVYNLSTETPTGDMELMERIVAPSNVREAYRRVKRNDGCPGVDGMSVEELTEYLRKHWQQVREELLSGTYRPSAVRRHELPKPGGGIRILGIPTVLDRLIQQAVLQVLQPEWDSTFSEDSYGFRPGRSAKQAVEKAREHYRGGRIEQVIRELATYLRGWQGYFCYAYSKQIFRELSAWIKRRLRCYLWKQWGRAGYRELRKRGVSRDLAWNTCKSHHGPWRLSRSPALAFALTTRYFTALGLPLLHVNV